MKRSGEIRVSRRAVVPLVAGGYLAAATAGSAAPLGAAAPGGDLGKVAPDTVLNAGVYRVASNLTVKGDLVLQPGACIEVAAGCTLAVLGAFLAPVSPVFLGAGRVDLNRSRTPVAYPEWFGAVSGASAVDCLPALRACLAAHPVMALRPADYWISDTFVIDRPFVRIWGSGHRGTDSVQGTRLLIQSATADVVRVGAAQPPGSVNAFLQNVDLRWMELGRTVPTDPRGRLPAGLRVQYVLFCHFEGLSAREHSVGFQVTGAVRTRLRDCVAFRSITGRSGGPFYGFRLGGTEAIGLAGANGSVFVDDCNVSIGGAPDLTDSVGLLLEGGFADTFVTAFEATSLATGIRIDGQTALLGGRERSGHANLHLRSPVIDQCLSCGIDLRDTSPFALIDITDPYVAVAPWADAAIRLGGCQGVMTIVGGQLIGRSAARNAKVVGLSALRSSGLDATGLKIADFANPVSFEECTGFRIQGQVHNAMNSGGSGNSAAGAAVLLKECRQGMVQMRISGLAGAFETGVELPRAAGPLVVDTALFDQAVLRGAGVKVGGTVRQPERGASVITIAAKG
jgi:hypothetical protein